MAEVTVRLKPDDKLSVVNVPSWDDVCEDIENKLRNIIETKTYVDQKEGGEYGYEVYIDKRYPTFCDNTLREISKLGIELGDGVCDHIEENYCINMEIQEKFEKIDFICDEFEKLYPDEFNDYQGEITDLINELIYTYVSKDDLNQQVDVAITLDVGDGNYDFSMNNVFNTWSSNDELDPLSPVAWLAKTQGKLTDLKKAIKEVWKGDYNKDNHGQFVNSCISELENQTHCMSAMTFLVKMGLCDYVKLQGMIYRQDKLNEQTPDAKYHYDKRIDNGEYITIGKNVECGLFNPWIGGGSVLEIALEKDINIPMKAIWSAWIEVRGGCPYGYDIDNVYGIDRSVFREVVTLHGKNPWGGE